MARITPCGICKERMHYWGPGVQVAVTTPDGVLNFVSLGELQPYLWTGAYPAEELEHFEGDGAKHPLPVFGSGRQRFPFKLFTPCGICQEQLRYWGPGVRVAVTIRDGVMKFVSLGELQPYHWTGAYPAEELEHFEV